MTERLLENIINLIFNGTLIFLVGFFLRSKISDLLDLNSRVDKLSHDLSTCWDKYDKIKAEIRSINDELFQGR